MPRKSKPQERQFNPCWVDFSFNQREEILTYVSERDFDFSSLCFQCAEDGIKVSLSYSKVQDGYYLTLTPKSDAMRNFSCYIIRHTSRDRIVDILGYFVDHYVSDSEINFQGEDDYAW